MDIIRHTFPDHYNYLARDLCFDDDLPIVMTEKDAVKCEKFAIPDAWYLPVWARLSNAFEHRLTILLQELDRG